MTRRIVAVREDGETLSPVFARAPKFRVEENGRLVEVVSNPYREALPAGPPVADLMSRLGADIVIAGSFGEVAKEELRKRGIRFSTSLSSGSSGRGFTAWLTEKFKWQLIMVGMVGLALLLSYLYEKRRSR